MAAYTIDAAQTDLSQLVARAEAGEEIFLMRGAQPVAKIVPLEPNTKKRQFGAYRGVFSLCPAFFDPLPEDELDGWE
jgi:antitoxin (DNA-binding transcriptional repressor) of toxin-antitoxin stability system